MKTAKYVVLLLSLLIGLYACTEDTATVTGSITLQPITNEWTGKLVTMAYIHSLNKIVTMHKIGGVDSVFQDSNLNDSYYSDVFGTIKIGRTFDSLSNGDKLYWTPQNGFIVFDLRKYFGGTISNITTANLKIKLYKVMGFTNDLKFVVSIMDTTILTKTIKERIYAVQNSTGESCGYLNEYTVDIKDKFTAGGKVVIGIKAEDVNQLFAAVQYCKIELEADVTRASDSQISR